MARSTLGLWVVRATQRCYYWPPSDGCDRGKEGKDVRIICRWWGEEVKDPLVVDLEVRGGNRDRLPSLPGLGGLARELLHHARNDAGSLHVSLHCVCLACSGHAVGEERCVDALQDRVHHIFHLAEQLLLGGFLVVAGIKFEPQCLAAHWVAPQLDLALLFDHRHSGVGLGARCPCCGSASLSSKERTHAYHNAHLRLHASTQLLDICQVQPHRMAQQRIVSISRQNFVRKYNTSLGYSFYTKANHILNIPTSDITNNSPFIGMKALIPKENGLEGKYERARNPASPI